MELIIILVVLAALVFWGIAIYNRLVTLRNRYQNMTPEQRERIRRRLENASPEQRERLRQRLENASPEQRQRIRRRLESEGRAGAG